MKKASIIGIGNEILAGRIAETNSRYLIKQLLRIGIGVVNVSFIGDEVDSIAAALGRSLANCDIVLVTGGLGPTDDDLTRQAFARFLQTDLELDEDILETMKDFFRKRQLSMAEKNKIQAFIPKGTKALANRVGTAPGIMAKYKEKILVALPGVPAEMKQMYTESVAPELEKIASGQFVLTRNIKCFGAGESKIAQMLGDLMRRGRVPLINCTVHCGIINLNISVAGTDKQKALQMLDADEKTLRKLLGDLVYGTEEQTLAEVVGKKLIEKNKTLAVAESCTGGLLAKLLTDNPGASKYFTFGWVTYSNEAKISELGVGPELIEKYGAVSEPVAEAMARGARQKAKADFALAITGIAGPEGGTGKKPVGLVYIALASEKHIETKRFIFRYDRALTRLRAANTALNTLRLGC